MLTKTHELTLAQRAAELIKTSPGHMCLRLLVLFGVIAVLTFTSIVTATNFGAWGAPVNAESIPGSGSQLNTPANEGYPILSPDGLSLYIVSDRPGGSGMLDIWVASRANTDDPWGDPVNLGLPVNSGNHETSPTPVPGHGLFFVTSGRADGCGADDIYFTRFKHGAWEEPQNVGCHINSAAAESGPSYFEDENGNAILYFSSSRVGLGLQDIYFSVNSGPAQLDYGLSNAFNDVRPNVRKDGLEVVFDSNRTGSLGAQDIWIATRATTADVWSTPTHLGSISSSAMDARPSLSRDGSTMFFGSSRALGEGGSDIYITTREKVTGND